MGPSLLLPSLLLLAVARAALDSVIMVPAYPTQVNTTVARGYTFVLKAYKSGLTDSAGQGTGVTCTLHVGIVTAWGGSWTTIYDIPGVYHGDTADLTSDVYNVTTVGTLTSVGMYEVSGYCTHGSTNTWATSSGKNTQLMLLEPAVCGNGIVDTWSGETCENTSYALCVQCSCANNSVATSSGDNGCTMCGNGVVDAGEGCDASSVASCLANCTCPAGLSYVVSQKACTTCGNGVLDSSEQCDYDGSTSCLKNCSCSSGYVPSGSLNCTTCGNDVLDKGEECDYTVSRHCTSKCRCASGYSSNGSGCSKGDAELIAILVCCIGGGCILLVGGFALLGLLLKRKANRALAESKFDSVITMDKAGSSGNLPLSIVSAGNSSNSSAPPVPFSTTLFDSYGNPVAVHVPTVLMNGATTAVGFSTQQTDSPGFYPLGPPPGAVTFPPLSIAPVSASSGSLPSSGSEVLPAPLAAIQPQLQ